MAKIASDHTRSLERELAQCRRDLAQWREHEQRYRQMFESMIEGFALAEIILDEQGRPCDFRLLEVNEAFGRLTGFPPAQANGRRARELVPGVEPFWIDIFGKVALTGEAVRFENYAQKSGKWFDLFAYQTAPGCFAALFIDVTDRKHAEKAASEQSRLVEAVFTHSISPLVVLDRDYNFLRVNEAYARACRRDIGEFAGRNHFEMYPSDAKINFDEVVRTKRPFKTFTRPFVFPDQPERGVTYWDWTLVPVLDKDGEIEYLVFSLVDVTEQRLAEEALRESEARYRQQVAELDLIYRTAPVGLCVLDTQLRYVHINERLAEINGVPPEAHIGKTIREVVPDVAPQIELPLRGVLETGEPVLDVEATAETQALPGVQRTWISQYRPLKDDGRVVGINVVAEEITERRRLEETRRREREFRTLAENATDVISRYDTALRRIYANPAFATFLGRPIGEILGKTNREFGLPEDVVDFVERQLAQVFATGQMRTAEVHLPTPEGERVLESRAVPEFGPNGEVETVLAVSRDITERKRTEDALRESEQKYRTLVENLYEGIWLIDAQGITTFANARTAELLGYRVEEMLGKHLFEFMGKPAAEVAKANLERGYQGVKADYEFEFQRKDGTPILTRIATAPIFDKKGRYRGALAAVVDETERRRAEARLNEYTQGQDFLVGTALRLLQPMERSELFDFVTEKLYSLAEGGIVIFSEFDPVNQRAVLRSMGSTAEEQANATRLVGREPVGFSLNVPEAIRAHLLPGEFEQLAGGLCELTFFQLPQGLCDALERALDIQKVYAMTCSAEQDLLGRVAVLTKGGELRNKRLIETVVTQAALALKRKRAEDALQSERNFFDTVYDSQGAIVAILDRHHRVVRLNHAYYEVSGFPIGSMIGRDFSHLMDAGSGETAERQLDALTREVATGKFETLIRIEEGGTRNISWRSTVRRDKTGTVEYVIATGIDITERKRMEENTRHLAQHDALTDLPNRRLLLELLDAAMHSAQRSGHKIALLFVDLDRFKTVNDTLGHKAGDTLLQDVAHRLSARVRRSDIVARLAGDEFTVLLGELIRGEQAGEVAEEIMNTFQQPFQLAGQSAYVTASVGISLYPDDSDNAEGLLHCADLAMYEAKDQGRNTYRFYNPILDRRSQERAYIENRLRQALQSGGLCLRYQPEIDLRTGQIVTVEALVRWQHPDLGLLDATRFIPVAEESGLIKALDDWVLRTACAQITRWRDHGYPPIRVAVNLSAESFESADLVKRVQRRLNESGLAPEHLELELTEHTVMRRIDQSIRQMRELVALGVGITVDDFGTGYSSLNYIKRLPVGKLKIDKSFVRDIASDAGDRAIIQAVTTMAHTLDKQVIAEGVETETQRAFLAGTGCDVAQGYLFTEPLAPERLAELFSH